ncbi:MAG: chorismate mutase [Fretibacterium sp.]|nr:chorismate mutase [Fretibacterium sp.]
MDIAEIRTKIDAIDSDMLKLFLQRMELMHDVADYKNVHNLSIVDRGREREVLARLMDKAGDMEEYAFYFFSKLISLACARQNEFISAPTKVRAQVEQMTAPLQEVFPKTGTVACQGVEGSNAQSACDKLLPRGRIMYVKSFKAVFEAVESGLCKYGVLPVENSSNGSVRAVYELLLENQFSIVRSITLFIRHELLVKKGTKLEDIRKIYSHPQALGQCSNFLSSLRGIEILPYDNTASAAKMVSESDEPGLAAIAAPDCANLYGLTSLRSDIQDSDNNYTRFICISKEPVIYAGSNHISLILACNNTPGALNDILSKLAARGVNMSKLESCPVTGRHFEFMFFLELDASVQDPGVLPMLEDLERSCPIFRFLGNYALV